MSSGLTFAFLVVISYFLFRLAAMYLEQRKTPEPEEDEVTATLERLEQLEERIRVLERIITEDKYDLKKEIDSL